MKERLLNNWSLKLLSFAIALVIWLIVVNYDNPYTTRIITGIPVEITNEEVLTGNNMIYSVVGSQTASVRVRCPRKIVDSLRSSDFKATANFGDMYTLTNQVPITVTCSNARVTTEEITLLTQSLEVEIETVETKKMEIRPLVSGEPGNGYKVGEVTCSPYTVRVTAPSSFLDQINYVGVEINVEGISQNMSESVPLQFYSAGNNPLDTSNVQYLSVSASDIDVEVEILNVKTVNINYSVTGQDRVAFGYLYSGVELSQTSVQISGRRSDLAGISAITIPDGQLDVSNASENITKTFDIRSLLPEGTSLLEDEDYNLTVELKIEKQETREFNIKLSRMEIRNLAEGLDIVDPGVEAVITVQGLPADLDALKESEIQAAVDLSDLNAGSHSVEVEVTIPHGFTLVGSPRILIQLQDYSAETTTKSDFVGTIIP